MIDSRLSNHIDDKCFCGIANKNYIYLYIAILAALGAQRFLLEDLYAYVCVFPLILSVFYYQKNSSISLVFLIISLFISVDNGAGAYVETPSFIRYPIYIWSIFFIIQWALISRSKLTVYLFLMLPPLFITIFGTSSINITVLIRDVFIVVIVGLAIIQGSNAQKKLFVEWKFLILFLFVFLLSEIFNVIFFYSIENNDYLSYDSLKGFIAFSFFYLIHNKKYFISIFVGMLILFVMMEYGSRMPLLMFTLLTIIYIIKVSIKRFNIKAFFFLTLSLYIIFSIMTNLSDTSKFGFMINQAWEVGGAKEWLIIIDRVRYYESLMFFDRDILSILFGSGFGSGIYDVEGYLGFVMPHQTAFSLEELNSNLYYNFHDVWVDLGLRIGLLNILLFIYLITKRFLKDLNNSYVSLILLFLIFTTFYSTAGILLIAIFSMLSNNETSKQ